jgi:hypothetical protein
VSRVQIVPFTRARIIDGKSPRSGVPRRFHVLLGPNPHQVRGAVDDSDTPQAYLVEFGPGDELPPHFHTVDQFQVVVWGDGGIGKHAITGLTVHYADAYTPYGPVRIGAAGAGYYTLRSRPDSGAYRMPESRALLRRVPRRSLVWDLPELSAPASDAVSTEIGFPEQNDGVAASRLIAPPGVAVTGGDSPGGGGAFSIIVRGSGAIDGERLGLHSCIHAAPDEPAPAIVAGDEGVQLLVLRFAPVSDRTAGST